MIEPVFTDDVHRRLDALAASDPEVVRLLIYLATGDARGLEAVASDLVAEGELQVQQGRGLVALADLRAVPTA